MQIMDWSDASVAKRYTHVPNEFVVAIAAQVGGLIWADPSDEVGEEDDGSPGSRHEAEHKAEWQKRQRHQAAKAGRVRD